MGDPNFRADGSMKLGAQVRACLSSNGAAWRGMWKGSGYGFGDFARANGAALRGMFSRNG